MAFENKVGARIRTYREKLELTPVALAARCGISEAAVVSMEKGETLPSLGVLTKLARALGQRLGTFMDDQFKPDPVITRAADLAAGAIGGKAAEEGRSYRYRSLALGKPDRSMDPFLIELPPLAEEKTSSHEGEELLICAKGEVELAYGDEKHILKPGDSAYYNSVVSHAVRACGAEPATIYGIVYMPM
ncbi:MAG: helix-turn-helix domain-containing protein [Kiritimatiellia bacterium]